MKLKKLLMLLLIPALLVTMMAMSVSAEETEEDYLWNLYDLNFDELELDLNRFGFNFKVNYATDDGTMLINGMKKDELAVDLFHTMPFEDLKLSVVVEVRFRTNTTSIWISNLTNKNTSADGYSLLINRDGILCRNVSANPLSDAPVNDGEWHVVRTILEEDETLTYMLDGKVVYEGAAKDGAASADTTAGGFARYNLKMASTDTLDDAYVEIDYIRIGDGEKGTPTVETEPVAPVTSTPATDNDDDAPAGTTDKADNNNDNAPTTGNAQGDEKEPLNIGVIIGIAAAVIVVVAVVIIIIKKRK